MPAIQSLSVRPNYHVFKADEEGKLRKALDEATRYTLVADVTSKSQLLMSSDGAVGKFRFTSLGLKQVLAAACRGSYVTVTNLAGSGHPTKDGRSEYSLTDAIDIYNRIVSRRFGRFAGKMRLIKNLRDHTIEGLLGPRFLLFENSVLLERARAALEAAPRRCRFHFAVLAGRRLMFRYLHKSPLFRRADGEAFYGGYHFSNSEIGGEATVRAAVLLWRESSGRCSMGKFLGGRVRHAGKEFPEKLNRMFARVIEADQNPTKLKAAMDRLAGTSLELGLAEPEREKRIDRLVAILYQRNVPRGLARKAVESALFFGSSPTRDEPPRPLGLKTLSGRNALDLYNSLTDVGGVVYAHPLEAVEQAAYQLLTGRLQLK